MVLLQREQLVLKRLKQILGREKKCRVTKTKNKEKKLKCIDLGMDENLIFLKNIFLELPEVRDKTRLKNHLKIREKCYRPTLPLFCPKTCP